MKTGSLNIAGLRLQQRQKQIDNRNSMYMHERSRKHLMEVRSSVSDRSVAVLDRHGATACAALWLLLTLFLRFRVRRGKRVLMAVMAIR